MSKLLKPTYNNEKKQILANINTYVAIHDISCKCENPLKCIVLQIYYQEKGLKFSTSEIQQWLTTTEEKDTGKEDDHFDIDGDDLDALFGAEEDTNTR